MKNILVSLVIPAYNVEKLIKFTLESVLRQTLNNFECIVVNDFSTDNTQNIVKEYSQKDSRIKLINHRANAGQSAARNTGLRFAKGKYIAFLDSDDLIMPESLELRAEVLKSNNDSKVIGTYAGSITIDMNCEVPPATGDAKLKVVDFITAAGNCPFNANQPMFVTEKFKMFGGFDQSLKQAEDYDMWMKILRHGFKIVPTQKQLVTYRQTEGSTIRSDPLLHLDTSIKQFNDCYNTYPLEKMNDKFDTVLQYGLGDYTAQLNISNRVLEFIGIGLAKGEKSQALLERLLNYLPDYFEIIESHRPFIPHVRKGINRYFKEDIDINSAEKKDIRLKIDSLYFDFKVKSVLNKEMLKPSLEPRKKYSLDDIVGRSNIQKHIDVVFFPHKDYHVHKIYLMRECLERLGVSYIIIDNSMHYRDEGLITACEKYNLPQIGYSNFLLGGFKPKAIVVFNDWDPILRSILVAAKLSGIPTVGIVEGIQDYLDVDTKQNRNAYKTVDHLFLPGKHDAKYFQGTPRNIYIGGVPRIHAMFKKTIKKTEQPINNIALINSNFSYGVLEEHRDEWVRQAVAACANAGYQPVITRHPADKGTLYPELVTNEGFYTALEKSSVLISRFASGIIEAAAAGIMPIYFNPHKEKVDKFYSNHNSYPIVEDSKSLSETLKRYSIEFESFLKNRVSFIEDHCGDLGARPQEYIPTEISRILRSAALCDTNKFFNILFEVDRLSGCFNNLNAVRNLDLEKLYNNQKDEPERDVTIKDFYYAISSKDFGSARRIYLRLVSQNEDNPAYKSMKSTLDILQRFSG